MTDVAVPFQSIDELPLPDIELPPTNLPYDDGDKMESSWHADTQFVLKASVIAAHAGNRDNYYVANNMFVYYSLDQVRNKDYKGPDVFVVKQVDGQRYRHSWIAWAEGGRLPDVIFELLSPSTEAEDLGKKKALYEQVFRTAEYFCISYAAEKLLGWRLVSGRYVPIEPDANGRLWSETLGVALGRWEGRIMAEQHTWPRFFNADGQLVLLPEEQAAQAQAAAEAERERATQAQAAAEAERERATQAQAAAEAERERADALAARLAELEAELQRLRNG